MKKCLSIIVFSLAFALSAMAQTSISVIPFTGLSDREGNLLANMVGTEMKKLGDYEIAARTSAITSALKEQSVQRQGLTDTETIAELGKGANAKLVVSGHVQKLGDNKIVSVSIIDVETFQQISGDYIEYQSIDSVVEYMPIIAKALVSKLKTNYKKLPTLAIFPFEADKEASESDKDVLGHILAIQLANSGKYAVVTRTSALNGVMKELNIQRQGLTDENTIAEIGKAINADYVLSGNITKLANSGYIEANIINVKRITLEKGSYKQYRKIEEGVKALGDLSYELTGVKNISGHLAFDIGPSIAAGVTTTEGIQLEQISMRDALRKYDGKRGIDDVKELLKTGIDTKSKSKQIWDETGNRQVSLNGWSSLMIASRFGYTDLVIAFVLEGADVNLAPYNSSNLNALTLAIDSGHNDIVDILLVSKADPNFRNSVALKYAIQKKNLHAVKSLIKYKIDISRMINVSGFPDNDKDTALVYACRKKVSVDIIRALIEAGADINEVEATYMGETPLIRTAGSFRVIGHDPQWKIDAGKLLLESGANVNLTTKRGNKTALMATMGFRNHSFDQYDVDFVKIILKYNPLLNVKDSDGKTALDIADNAKDSNYKKQIIGLLEDAGAKYGWEL